MGRHGARKEQDGVQACPADLKRLTRAELIRVISGLQSQIADGPGKRLAEGLPAHAPIMLVDGSVRSGQTVVFREGDIIVVGSIGSGAEITAGGSIHVYGALRGKAHAGVAGGTGARIFCQKLEAELLEIEGVSRRADDLDSILFGRPAHAWRELNHIGLAQLSTIPAALQATEPPEAAIAAPQRPSWLSWARRAMWAVSERPVSITSGHRQT